MMICTTISSPKTSHIQYTRVPSPVYQYVVNLVVSLTTGGGPGVFMNVLVREHRALNNQIFLCVEVYYSSPIMLMETLLSNCNYTRYSKSLLLCWCMYCVAERFCCVPPAQYGHITAAVGPLLPSGLNTVATYTWGLCLSTGFTTISVFCVR